MRKRLPLPLLTAVAGLVAALVAAWLFPRAFAIVALEQRLTRAAALVAADSFFAAHALAPPNAHTAVRFQRDDSLRTFVELAGGGADSLNALVRGADVAPYRWSVRAFVPGDPREARVDFAPDGRVIGFERKLAESDVRPDVGADSAQRLAEGAFETWTSPRPGNWSLVSTSFDTKPGSGRVDRTFTFERGDRRIGDAPIRTDVVIAGDLPSGVRPYVDVPESFRRRYAEMRSWNNLLSVLASVGVLAIAIAGIVALSRYSRSRSVRWRPAMLVGGTIGVLTIAAALNEMPGSWFGYDTAMSPVTFRAMQFLLAIAFGVTTTLMTGFTLAAAEAATRHAFPRHLDWWKLWRHRGSREVAGAVWGGYAVAAIALAYVVVFYLVTRTLFGWWVPSELLDDPNQMASPLPWISGIALSLNAAVWEETLFRALPLSLLSLWVGRRAGRTWWMAGGVVVTALVFGFAHANYDSWPPYSRGLEIFLDACFWAVLFLAFGLLVTVVAHFVYNSVLFGIFAAQGSALEYRMTAAIILAVVLAPAAIVLWRRVRQRGWTAAPDEARFGAWTPGTRPEPSPSVAPPIVERGTLTPRARRLALAAVAVAALIAVGRPPAATLGPRFTADRADAIGVADSALRSAGVSAEGWTRLTQEGRDTLPAWRRFLLKHELSGEAQRLATFNPPAWWVVRYVHTEGTPAERTEEWRIRVWPDGRLLDARHIIPDSARRDTADATGRRRIALAALARAEVDTGVLRETDVTETARPARIDVTVTYTDTSVVLPAGAEARASVQIAGDEPLVARRGVELPEEFLREDRGRMTTRAVITGAVGMLLIALLLVGALVVKRRAAVVDDGHFATRHTALVIGSLLVLTMLSQLNSLPDMLSGYDTAQPWSNFIAMSVLGLVWPVVIPLVLFGLWRAADGLRRRVGIPMLPAEPSQADRVEMVVVGMGIAGVAFAATRLASMARGEVLPRGAVTTLNSLVPAVSGVMDVPMGALTMVVVVAIPMLVVAGLTRRWPLRAATGAMGGAIVAAIAWAGSDGEMTATHVVVSLVAQGVVVWALVAWGSRVAWSWVVAALTFGAFGGLRTAVYGATWTTQVDGMLVVLAAAGLIALIARRATAGGFVASTPPAHDLPGVGNGGAAIQLD